MEGGRMVDGIPVDPALPEGFFATPNDKRPASHQAFWNQPFVLVVPHAGWEGGFRYDTWCLDGGAWDRPTSWGKFGTLDEAIRCANRATL
jgi:hypothetical protein